MNRDLSNKKYDVVIVGAGIAGLATAELFSRSGLKVILIEKEGKVCQEASGAHHGWFHFGSLYSIFPNNQFLRTLVGGIDDLLDYYSEFAGMNIKVTSEGALEFANIPNQWFRDEPIEYIVTARNDPDFALNIFHGVKNYAEKLFFLATWELAIKQFISRHRRFHNFKWGSVPASSWIPKAGWFDYTRDVITKPDNIDINLDVDTHFRIVGFDRPMVASMIISDLLRSFLSTGGDLSLKDRVVDIHERKGNYTSVITDLGEYFGRNIIVAGGHHTQQLLGNATELDVVLSPLLITYPHVCDSHFVRLTPFVDKSVNHIWHEIDGRKYSVIGGGYFADPAKEEAVLKAKNDLLAMAERVFPRLSNSHISEVYYSHKTEVVPTLGERNYQYHIREIRDGLYMMIPGKFSLGFSLAVNMFEKIMKKKPKKGIYLDDSLSLAPYVDAMRHAKVVSKFHS